MRDADTTSVPWYGRGMDFESLWREYPPPPDYTEAVHRISSDELRARQEARFLEQVARAWEVSFYRRHWGAAGLTQGDIRSLEDLNKIPPYTVDDVRQSIERCPPWGDFVGLDGAAEPLLLQTSGGTTSVPRPMLYAPRDREVMNILMGRRLFLQGVRPADPVQIALSFGLANGGMAVREGIWKYSGAIPIPTGSGASTPTRRQIEILREWKVRFLVGFPAYLRHMALVARNELELDPRALGLKGLLVHLGTDDRAGLEELWDAPVYDTYGVHECGPIAADCENRSGMHIFEDAFLVEVLDATTLTPKSDGEKGTIHLTALFKKLAPVIRYNVNDISSITPGTCPCGGTHRRLTALYGRSDHMVKLRGVNVFPEAVGAVVVRNAATNGEYVCIVETAGPSGQDEMTVMVEARPGATNLESLSVTLSRELKEAIGVRVHVACVAAGELQQMTGLNRTSKVQRLIDRRNKPVS